MRFALARPSPHMQPIRAVVNQRPVCVTRLVRDERFELDAFDQRFDRLHLVRLSGERDEFDQ